MHRSVIFRRAPSAIALCIAAGLLAGQSQAQDRSLRSDPFLEQSQAFLDGHPDLKYRNYGVRSYRKGEFAEAMRHFERAAFYGDKPSQAMVGEMYWKGEGVPADRALAYAWLDLAAERQYPNLLSVREGYWKRMDAAEQERALALGVGIYGKYGDDVAKKRLEAKLRAVRMKTTGSRTGAVGALTIYLAGPDGEGVSVDGAQFYNAQYWTPEQYWQWQDRTWKTLSGGKVRASELQSITPAAKPDQDGE